MLRSHHENNIVLDEKLVHEATTLTGVRTILELIDLAELFRSRRKKNQFDLTGKIQIANGNDNKQLRELQHDPDCHLNLDHYFSGQNSTL